MNRLIYIETSIPSFYFDTRPSPENQARRNWTRERWKLASSSGTLVTSRGVLKELEDAPEPKRSECLDQLSALPLLAASEEGDALVEIYIANKIMPADAAGDALYLALATIHQCDT